MKNFITLIRHKYDTDGQETTYHIDSILQFGPVENCEHKSYLITKQNSMVWIYNSYEEIQEKIKKAQT